MQFPTTFKPTMKASHLTLERLKELLYYNPETGIFTRLVSASVGTYAGDIAGNLNADGYVQLCIDYKIYRAHRLAWFYMTGEWPTKQVDHKDGIRSNNVFSNLRSASNAENCQNQRKPHKDSSSGFLGVSKKGYKWRSAITINGKQVVLGYFKTPELASEAYVAAKKNLHPFATSTSHSTLP